MTPLKWIGFGVLLVVPCFSIGVLSAHILGLAGIPVAMVGGGLWGFMVSKLAIAAI